MSGNVNTLSPPREKLSVLVAEDDEQIRDLIVRVLASAGYRPHAVDNGDDALTELCEGAYDIAILDVLMPGPGASEIVKRYRGSRKHPIPIILLTAYSTRSANMNGLASDVDAVLTKPVTRQELLDAIEKVATGRMLSPVGDGQSVPANPFLDERKLADLADDDPFGEFRKQLLRKFVSRAIGIVERIEQAVREENPAVVYELVHQLEGTAGMVGAAAIENACSALGLDPSVPSRHVTEEQVAELKRAVEEVARQLDQTFDLDVQQ